MVRTRYRRIERGRFGRSRLDRVGPVNETAMDVGNR
jgi:hypothetical protein